MEFKGTYVALVTPFTADNKIAEDKLREMVEYQIEKGTTGLVPCGTTGESPTLSWDEHKRVVEITVEVAKGRAVVIAGAGSNNTLEAVEAAKFAKEVGADAALVVSPYYNKPTQEGLYQHFKTVADESQIPIVLYNIMGRTGVNITTDTMVRLKEISNIVAVKEASGDIVQMSDLVNRCGDKFSVLSGDDSLTLPLLSLGGQGIISVIANILPAELKVIVDKFNGGDNAGALLAHKKLFPLCQAMFLETNPIPIREAMNLLGWNVGEARLPLTPMESGAKAKLVQAIKDFGLEIKG